MLLAWDLSGLENGTSLRALCSDQLAHWSFPWVDKLFFGKTCESNLFPAKSISVQKCFHGKGGVRRASLSLLVFYPGCPEEECNFPPASLCKNVPQGRSEGGRFPRRTRLTSTQAQDYGYSYWRDTAMVMTAYLSLNILFCKLGRRTPYSQD